MCLSCRTEVREWLIAYSTTHRSKYTASLTSSIEDYKIENGRRYVHVQCGLVHHDAKSRFPVGSYHAYVPADMHIIYICIYMYL
jgi:hypothetical protein